MILSQNRYKNVWKYYLSCLQKKIFACSLVQMKATLKFLGHFLEEVTYWDNWDLRHPQVEPNRYFEWDL